VSASLLSYRINHAGVSGELTAEANSRTIVYTFVYSEPVMNSEVVLGNPNVPSIGEKYPWNSSLFAESISTQQGNSGLTWEVSVNYSPDVSEVLEGRAYAVEHRSIIREVGTQTAFGRTKFVGSSGTDLASVPEVSEVDDIPIQNSAGDLLIGMTKVENNLLIEWWQLAPKSLESKIESGTLFQSIGTTNDAVENILGTTYNQWAVIIRDIRTAPYFYRDPDSLKTTRRYKITWTIEIQQGFYGIKVLDQGLNARLAKDPSAEVEEGAAPVLVKRAILSSDVNADVTFNSADDKEVREDIKLDGEGLILADDLPPVYFAYQTNKPTSFGQLSLATRRGDG